MREKQIYHLKDFVVADRRTSAGLAVVLMKCNWAEVTGSCGEEACVAVDSLIV